MAPYNIAYHSILRKHGIGLTPEFDAATLRKAGIRMTLESIVDWSRNWGGSRRIPSECQNWVETGIEMSALIEWKAPLPRLAPVFRVSGVGRIAWCVWIRVQGEESRV